MSRVEVQRQVPVALAPAGWRAVGARISVLGVVSGVVALILAYLMIPPLLVLLQNSIIVTNLRGEVLEVTLRHYQRILLNGALLMPLVNTLIFALSSCVIAL